MAESSALLAWRKKQPKGAIMAPATFDKIAKNSKGGKRAAGAAYWRTAERKFARSKGR